MVHKSNRRADSWNTKEDGYQNSNGEEQSSDLGII